MLKNERGATALFVAASMMGLIGIAALTIDYSAALNERRQDVGAADTAALAGAIEMGTTGALNPFQAIVDEAKLVADTNTPNAIIAAQWTACADPQALAIVSTSLGVSGGSPCISFSADFAKIRVRLPLQATETSFVQALGIDQIETYAVAEASLGSSLGTTGGFPAGAFSGTPAGAEFCLKASTGGHDNCPGSSTGNFGDFQPYFYTDVDSSGVNTECNSGLATAPLGWAMANGIDHRLGRTDVIRAVGTRVNGASRPGTPGPFLPYQVDSGGGYSNADITQGLVLGGSYGDGFTGRLDRGPYQDPDLTIFGTTIDTRPLWAFIRTGSGLHSDCEAARALPAIPGYALPAEWDAAKALMASCLANETGLLFKDEIATSARVVTIPVFHQTAPLGSNACCYDIKSGLPIFIESMWATWKPNIDCTPPILFDEPARICRHDAGMQGDISAPPGNERIESASAFVLSPAHLPPSMSQPLRGGSGSVFVKVELTR